MNKLATLLLTLIAGIAFSSSAFAESATKEECIAQCKAAAEMVANDQTAAIAEIGNKNGKFVWKDTYVFLMDLDGNMLAHPMKPALTEKGSLLGIPDKNKDNPKMLFADFVEVASNQGEGWVDYMWPKPGETEPSLKDTYVYRVPGTNLFTAAGIYK